MNNARLFHGTSDTPNSFWFPYIRRELEAREYEVWSPQLPEADTPRVETWVPFALENATYDADSVLIGHSAGCPLILQILEKIEKPVHQVILVAGYAQHLADAPSGIISEFNWEKIRSAAEHFYIINSDNDPWGCDVAAGQYIFDRVGGTFIIKHGEGHMGSERFNQPYRTFPLLLKLVEAEAL